MIKLLISYETPEGKTADVIYEDPPSLHSKQDGTVFAKGVLADRNISYNRILEIQRSNVIYSAYDEGLVALSEV